MAIFQRVIVGCDHAGFALKNFIMNSDLASKIEFIDLGAYDESVSVDYPDYASLVAEALLEQGNDASRSMGLLICGTGIGISIKANRYHHIRAALCHNVEYAKLSRLHNDANVLVLGGRFIEPEIALEIFQTFINTTFEGGRHSLRVDKL